MTVCTVCGEAKPFPEGFYRQPASKSGYTKRCKPCIDAVNRRWRAENADRVRDTGREQTKRWRRANPEKARELKRRGELRMRYGMEVEDYDRMLEAQGGVCAICAETCPSGMRLSVDHAHDSGEVRGLLCGNCNRALGYFKDDPDRLKAAIAYLGVSMQSLN